MEVIGEKDTMKLQLYYCPGSCSFVPHVALEQVREITGLQYEITEISLKNGQQRTPEYKAINPKGQVPALIVDGRLVNQIVAIISFLHQTFPVANILPNNVMENAQAVSMLAWINNTVHPAFTRIFKPERVGGDAAKEGVREVSLQAFKQYLSEMDTIVSHQPYLCGSRLTPADVYVLTLIHGATTKVGINSVEYPNLVLYAKHVSSLPPVARAMAREDFILNVE